METLNEIRERWYKDSVKEFGEETAKKMWRSAKDPVTGYVSKNLSALAELDGEKYPCQRCGGYGMWTPQRGDEEIIEVLCLKCFDDWSDNSARLLKKHGYVWSKKKWHSAFMEFCQSK